MVGDRSEEPVLVHSSQSKQHHQELALAGPGFPSADVVVATFRNVVSGGTGGVSSEKNGTDGVTNDLVQQHSLSLSHHCIVSTNPSVVTVTANNSDGNHLSVHRVIRNSHEEEVEEEVEECCVVDDGGTGGEGGILTAVVAKHHPHHSHQVSVAGVSLAEIQQQQQEQEEHEALIGVEDTLQHHHHHVSVNMGHHHVDESGTGTIITIPVGSLTPYTVIGDGESNDGDGGTMSVTLAQETLSHHTHQQQHGTHQLVQSHQVTQLQADSQCNSHLTWEEAVSAPVLPVRCKDTNAELHKSKFGSGNKGKCIKHGNDWFTPTEFEALCGRGNSKDWKRSIRFGGRTLQTLIDKGFLIPHASSCICSNCVDDATATGPIRPFTPYQRKRKGQSMDHMKGTKLERLTSKDSNTDESSDIGTPGTPLSMATGLNPLTQALMKINQVSLPPCTQEAWKVVEDAVDSIVTAGSALRSILQEMKERTNQETESLRSQLQNSVQTTLVQNPIVGQPQILRIFDSNRIQTYSIEVLDPDSFKPLPSNTTGVSKCENCGRDGSLECSGCHVVHYCSSFCQKKDWPTHQSLCSDRGHPECKTEPDLP